MTFRLTLIVTTVAVLQVGGVDSVFAQGTLYDDFSSPFIRGDRWRTDQPEIGPGSGLETLRLVSGGALLLAHRVIGGRTSDVGSHISAARLYFNPSPGGALKFDVTMLSVTATPCSVGGSNFTDAEARGVLELFQNEGSVATATIGLQRLSTRTDLRAVGGVTGLGSVDLGPVPIGTKVTLRMSWDPVNNRIDFQRNAEPVRTVTYDVDDSIPIASPFLLFEAVGFVPNCTASAPPTAVISALFDNVSINP